MRLIFVLTVVLCFIPMNVSAQQDESVCSIVFLNEATDGMKIDLFSWQAGGYIYTESLMIPDNSLIRQSHVSTEFSGLAIYHSTGEVDSFTDLYKVTLAGFEKIDSILTSPTYSVAPRPDPFSYTGRFLTLHNTFGIRNNRLVILDTETSTLYEPTDLSEVLDVTWSSSQNMVAFIAYNTVFDGEILTNEISDFGIYVSDPQGTTSKIINIDQEKFARFHWISGQELAVTSCIENDCISLIYNTLEDTTTVWNFGDYLLEGYITRLDSFLLSRVEDRNLFLIDRYGNMTQISYVDRVLSLPLVSVDEQYISFRASESGKYNLYIADIANSFTFQTIELADELPELLASNAQSEFRYDLTFYTQFDAWNPKEDTLLYEDNNTISIFDPHVNTSSIVVEGNGVETRWNPRWVCSEM